MAGPKDLFQALYHHFLCLADTTLQVSAAQGSPVQRSAGFRAATSLAGVKGDVEGERLLCVRAMAAVYSKHAAVIGKHHANVTSFAKNAKKLRSRWFSYTGCGFGHTQE